MRLPSTNTDDHCDQLMTLLPRGVSSRYMEDQRAPGARWQEASAIAQSKLLSFDPNDPGGKVLIGHLGNKLIGFENELHYGDIAGTRGGKSVQIISNLHFYQGSVVVNDPKAEIANATANIRVAMGQQVLVLDPFEIANAKTSRFHTRFNPINHITASSPSAIEDAINVADGLTPRSDREEPHWNDGAQTLIKTLILQVATDPAYEGRRFLATVRALIMAALAEDESVPHGKNDPIIYLLEEQILVNAERLSGNPATQRLGAALAGGAADFFDRPDKERDSVLSTTRRHTAFLDIPAMQEVTSGHDFDLETLKTAPSGVTIYLCLPAGKLGMCSRWLRVFINLLIDSMEHTNEKPRAPVLVCLDEFAILGYMKLLEDALAYMAGFDVRFHFIIQDLSQLKSIYKDRWESFIANIGVLRCYGNADLFTTEYLSRLLGKTPVTVVRQGETTHDQQKGGATGRSIDQQLYPLLTPDEISRHFARDDPYDRQLVLLAGKHPMVLSRARFYDKTSPVYKAISTRIRK